MNHLISDMEGTLEFAPIFYKMPRGSPQVHNPQGLDSGHRLRVTGDPVSQRTAEFISKGQLNH